MSKRRELFFERWQETKPFKHCVRVARGNRPGGVLSYIGYIGMCSSKGYGFSAVMVIKRVSILANFGYFGHK